MAKALRPGNRMVAYRRVSSQEQADSGNGLEAQRTTIMHAVTARGWTLVADIEDAGFSGSKLNRPGLEHALGLVRSGQADGIVVGRLDRLSRSLLDFASLMTTAKREGWSIVALDLGVDMTTPAGEMLANVLASFAQYERQIIGQRTSDALQAAKAQGRKLGRPNTVDESTIERIREMRTERTSFRKIADALNAEGIPGGHGGRWQASTVLRVLEARDRQEQEAARFVCPTDLPLAADA